MPSPFPGMNPYLEHPALWPEVHSRLIVAIADSLNPQLLPKYRAALDRRVYEIDGSEALLVGIPDVTVEQQRQRTTSAPIAVLTPTTSPISVQVPVPLEIRESFLQVQEVATRTVVTAIELLSPTNKQFGRGRSAYETKRREVLASQTHLVEIDLLRSGQPMTILQGNIDSHYRILVSRGNQRPRADLYAFNLQDAIPPFPLPLQPGDVEPLLDLQPLLNQVYDRAGFDVTIDYAQAPTPALEPEDVQWAKRWIVQY